MTNRVPSMRAAGPVRGRKGAGANGVLAPALSSRGGAGDAVRERTVSITGPTFPPGRSTPWACCVYAQGLSL